MVLSMWFRWPTCANISRPSMFLAGSAHQLTSLTSMSLVQTLLTIPWTQYPTRWSSWLVHSFSMTESRMKRGHTLPRSKKKRLKRLITWYRALPTLMPALAGSHQLWNSLRCLLMLALVVFTSRIKSLVSRSAVISVERYWCLPESTLPAYKLQDCKQMLWGVTWW